MTVQTIAYLKARFADGTFPNGQDFADLIDTLSHNSGTVTGISVSPSSLTMAVGDSPQIITATVIGVGTFDPTVIWTSSDNSIGSIASNGAITANGIGSATMTATSAQDASFFATCSLTVTANINTKPRLGYAPAYDGTNAATIFSNLAVISGSTNNSKVAGSSGSPLTVTPSGSNYAWFACANGVGAPTFNGILGTEVWDGATTNGQLFNAIDSGPTTVTHISYNDGTTTWNLYRQELLLTTESFWVT